MSVYVRTCIITELVAAGSVKPDFTVVYTVHAHVCGMYYQRFCNLHPCISAYIHMYTCTFLCVVLLVCTCTCMLHCVHVLSHGVVTHNIHGQWIGLVAL